MIEYSILKPEGILVLEPKGSLSKEDFDSINTEADHYLSTHDKLIGVLIHSKAFPGWKGFAGFAAHMRFVRDHHKKTERVAVVTDSHLAGTIESLAKHFVAAEVKHFPYTDKAKAVDWLKEKHSEGDAK